MVLAIVIILLIWALWFFGPLIRRWVFRRSVKYMQDRMYRSMGIDPSQMRDRGSNAGESGYGRRGARNRRKQSRSAGKIIPADYGESVSFEIFSVTGKEKWLIDTEKSPVFVEYRSEIQISDVQYVIIT